MADPDEMAKKFFQDIQNTQKQIVDGLAETREALRILTEKLQGIASINEKGSTSEEPRNGRSTPSKSTKSIFLPADEPPVPNLAINPVEEVTGNLITLRATYNGLDDDFRSSVPFREYVDMMNALMPKKENRREHDTSGRELKNKISKFTTPTFDGTNKISARAWLQKLQTFFTLNPMKESDAIQFASLHLEDATYDWWYHGMTTQGHDQVTTFEDFSQRVIDRFDLKDDEEYFKELSKLKQTKSVNEYIEEFQKVAVMVPDMSEKRIVYLFLDGLEDSVKGLVKAFSPSTLQEAIKRSLQLETCVPMKSITNQKPPNLWQHKGNFQKKTFPTLPPKDVTNVAKKKVDEETRSELRRKKLCFTCREPWVPGHRCLGKGQVHYIEVASESDSDEHEEFHDTKEEVEEEKVKEISKDGTLAALSGVPRYHPF